MSGLVLDSTLAARFVGLREAVEFRDESGRVLGDFAPATTGPAEPGPPSPFTAEELGRFAREPGGRILAEILADLERVP